MTDNTLGRNELASNMNGAGSSTSANTANTNDVRTQKFPTVGLKSLLQNSDLLEILMKPFGKTDDDAAGSMSSGSSSSGKETSNGSNQPSPSGVTLHDSPASASSSSGFSDVDLASNCPLDVLNDLSGLVGIDPLDPKSKSSILNWQNFDDILDEKTPEGKTSKTSESEAKTYGNAFLGPNLWDKNDLFQGGVKFEHLEIDEFLNENGLNETDVQFLDQIQKLDTLNNQPQPALGGTTSNNFTPSINNNNNSMNPSTTSPIATSTLSKSTPVPVPPNAVAPPPSLQHPHPHPHALSHSHPRPVHSAVAVAPPPPQQQQQQQQPQQLSHLNTPINYHMAAAVSQQHQQTSASSSYHGQSSLGPDHLVQHHHHHQQQQQHVRSNSINYADMGHPNIVVAPHQPVPAHLMQPATTNTKSVPTSSLFSQPVPTTSQQQPQLMASVQAKNISPISSSSGKAPIIPDAPIISSHMSRSQSYLNSKESKENGTIELRQQQQHQHSSSKMSTTSADWNNSNHSRDVSIYSGTDSDDFDPSMLKFSDDELRPQPILRKSKKQFVPNEMKDDKYWARRRKNNIAAKRSRDARRVKENQIAIRASYLERENDTLRKQLDDFKRETKALKHRIAKYESIYPQLANLDINK